MLQQATRNYFNDIIMNLDREIYKTNNHIDVDAHRKFKQEVDQYIETYGNEDLEANDANSNFNQNNADDANNDYPTADYENPEFKGSKNAKFNSNNKGNRSNQRKQ